MPVHWNINLLFTEKQDVRPTGVYKSNGPNRKPLSPEGIHIPISSKVYHSALSDLWAENAGPLELLTRMHFTKRQDGASDTSVLHRTASNTRAVVHFKDVYTHESCASSLYQTCVTHSVSTLLRRSFNLWLTQRTAVTTCGARITLQLQRGA